MVWQTEFPEWIQPLLSCAFEYRTEDGLFPTSQVKQIFPIAQYYQKSTLVFFCFVLFIVFYIDTTVSGSFPKIFYKQMLASYGQFLLVGCF